MLCGGCTEMVPRLWPSEKTGHGREKKEHCFIGIFVITPRNSRRCLARTVESTDTLLPYLTFPCLHSDSSCSVPIFLLLRSAHISMPAFDIVVVGSGGGLDETNLSGCVSSLTWSHACLIRFLTPSDMSRRYLVKPCNKSWDGGIVALEAGALGHPLENALRVSRC